MGRSAAVEAKGSLQYNLGGQRLGRKGRGTRDAILAAAERLLAQSIEPISVSAVAREASLGMTTLYHYYGDLTEILLAILDPIMASAEQSYVAHLREHWPDKGLYDHCLDFVQSYHAFWQRNTRILHLRNSLADAHDERMRAHRIRVSQPLMQLLVRQMDGDPAVPRSLASGMATVLLTGIERLVTVMTDVSFASLAVEDPEAHIDNLLHAEARLLEFAIRDGRIEARHGD